MAPYTLVLVDLQEGARLMGHGQADLAIGDEVIASFEELGTRGIVFFRRGANPVCTSQTNEGA
jgi:uncharacterized OB-fold protein